MLNTIKKRISKLTAEAQAALIEEYVNLADTPKVSEEEFLKRIAICEACPNFDDNSRRCKLCLCPMDVKATLEINPFSFKDDNKIVCSDTENQRW